MLRAEGAKAAGVDPTMTMITPPDQIPWQELYNFPRALLTLRPCSARSRSPASISL
jgi:hypothetical protein